MNTPLRPIFRKTHPMLLVAAGAVTLASLTATATLLGWLPAGHATSAQNLASAAPPASLANALPSGEYELPASKPGKLRQVTAELPAASPASENLASKPHQIARTNARPGSERRAVEVPASPSLASTPLTAPPELVPATAPMSPRSPEVPRSAPLPPVPACAHCGEVESIREIARPGEGSGLGAVGGAVAGGLLGKQIGKGKGNQLATLLGVVGGAFAGHQVEKNARAERDTEVIVRLDDGSTRSIVHDGTPVWRPGDRVRVVNGQLQSL
ncbi:MAG: glycine zipper 2TM domain-containing protein [Azonexus sp.]|nr:glycine zipper 2TM domain-containing protein [Azonexus sp.]MCK6412976.1 glycine zipper 2TM domain-containing protein [Azonexus sp.]